MEFLFSQLHPKDVLREQSPNLICVSRSHTWINGGNYGEADF